MGSLLQMLVVLSMRNLYSHKVKNLIVGSIMFFGTLLVVVGTAVLDSVESAMSRSIISSLAGHVQVYSADAKDDLALFGGEFMGAEDIGEINDFASVKAALEEVPNVEAVVPMGISMAAMSSGNELDRILTALRGAVKAGDRPGVDALIGQVKQVVDLLIDESQRKLVLSGDPDKVKREIVDLERAASGEFWTWFEEETELALTFLDSRIAPIAPDDPMIYMRYLGTDLHEFAKRFDRFEITAGEMVPQGKRGLLINQKFYDDWVKHKVARELDQVRKEVDDKGHEIAKDPKLAAKVRRMKGLYREVTFQLDPEETAVLLPKLREKLGDASGGLNDLVKSLLAIDDENLADRYAWFYEHVAPLIDLYRVPIGGNLTVRSYTKSGFVKSVNVKAYGAFTFKGLEASDLAGSTSLMDIVTFRELYGQATAEMAKEAESIKAEIGLQDVGRADAEDSLFGGEETIVGDASDSGFDEFEGVEFTDFEGRRKQREAAGFDLSELSRGLALNAAVLLRDADKLEETTAAIQAKSESSELGVKAVDWQTASGIVGQFIVLVRLILYVVIAITFTVALVIINNSMIMATMERVTEIGTMRAIGAQRNYVMFMFLLETIVLGLLAGSAGALAGGGIVTLLGSVGIPAPNDILVFLFSGPRLFPTVASGHMISGILVILLVSLVSTLYPARIATRIEPVVAMQAGE